MADWKQIRARIRRAKTGPDATMRLEQLYDKTRDGMVAFELAQLEEISGRLERATDWYKRAWQRFRRAEWKQKAEEALVRHGIPIPPPGEAEPAERAPAVQPPPAPEEHPLRRETGVESESVLAQGEVLAHPQHLPPTAESSVVAASEQGHTKAAIAGSEGVSQAHGQRPRRRRHRGGRGKGRGRRSEEAPTHSPAEPVSGEEAQVPSPVQPRRSREPERHIAAEHRPPQEPMPAVQVYRRPEPALASKIKALEAKLRQLLAAQPHSLAELGELPANPGVYLVSDLDLTTIYYLEDCGNMRSAVDQLTSGRRGRQGSIRSRLAKYLGINDSQAGRYIREHCVARWIALEESDSNALGHFARAVLQPELMEGED